jgi:hypothetical protein
MNEWEKWQPLFRFLGKLDNSAFVGLIFAIICFAGAFAGWYWVLFKKGAEIWKAGIVSWNKRFGINVEWIPPLLLKIAASIILLGMLCGVFAALFAMVSGR